MYSHRIAKEVFYKTPRRYRTPHTRKLNKGKSKEEISPRVSKLKKLEGRKKYFFSKTKQKIEKKNMLCGVDSLTAETTDPPDLSMLDTGSPSEACPAQPPPVSKEQTHQEAWILSAHP